MCKLLLTKAILFSNTSDCSGLKMNRSALKLRKWQESVYRQNWVYDEVLEDLWAVIEESPEYEIWIELTTSASGAFIVGEFLVSIWTSKSPCAYLLLCQLPRLRVYGWWFMGICTSLVLGLEIWLQGDLEVDGEGGEQVALKSLAVSVWVNLSINQICQGPQFCSVKYFKFTLKQFTEMTEIFIFPFIFNNELYNLTSKNTCINVWYKGSLQQSFSWLFLSHTPIIQ